MADEFETFLPLGTKLAKQMDVGGEGAIFKNYSLGVCTNRDEWIYAFDKPALAEKVERLIANYNAEAHRLAAATRQRKDIAVDRFVNVDPAFLKWTDRLKSALEAEKELHFNPMLLRPALYRPFTLRFLYFDELLVHRRYQQHHFFPTIASENIAICCTNHSQVPFSAFMTQLLPDAAIGGRGGHVFPFYTYAEDGSERRENITDWALKEFQTRYGDRKITKWDIFHYVYAVLHHPQYRERYAANLRRELARIPFVGRSGGLASAAISCPSAKKVGGARQSAATPEDAADFHAFAAAGKRLAELHVGYEQAKEYPLKRRENPKAPL